MNKIKFDESFNWLAVLKDLAAGMPIDERDHLLLTKRAGEWPTCACSQLCKDLPRDEMGAPVDWTLFGLGLEFYRCVRHQAWRPAITQFHLIEERTTWLLEPNGPHKE